MHRNRRRLISSFYHALRGIFYACRGERNMVIHLIIAFTVLTTAFLIHLDKFEFLIILLCIAFVLTLETINTAFEYMVDLFHGKQENVIVKMLKDVASAAVLMASIFSAIIGLWIFLPRLLNF